MLAEPTDAEQNILKLLDYFVTKEVLSDDCRNAIANDIIKEWSDYK